MQADLTQAKMMTDFTSLQQLRASAKNAPNESAAEMAKQFESVFTQMVIKSMRKANETLFQSDLLSSHSMSFYQDMFDQQLSLELSTGKGLGLAEVLMEQLNQYGTGSEESKTKALTPTADPKQNAHTDASGDAKSTEAKAITQDKGLTAFGSPSEFLKALSPIAKDVASVLGVDHKVLLAQAALETGWGKKIIKRADGTSSFNLFNIKALGNWPEDKRAMVSTLEYKNGVGKHEQAPFRTYGDFKESFMDYMNLIKNNQRYQNAIKNVSDPKTYLNELQKAGYATDPSYSDKIFNLLNGDTMKAFFK
jgi:peptidoglycan hydrolase FlgJ